MSKNILVTGGLGFIGSNFIQYMNERYQNYKIINIDSITYAANKDNLNDLFYKKNYKFVKCDIRNKESLSKVFEDFLITDVIHFAAESHVDNSIKNPTIFAETNIMGTLNLLEVSRDFWMESPFVYKEQFIQSKFHHISTDEVYGTLGDTGYFTEETNYAPNSPYSASKAASDMLVRSYFHTYGLNVVTTNCSNNYGPKQHDEKLIPTLIRNALKGEKLPIYGNGENVRDWLYVKDHCSGIDVVFHRGKVGETYLIGGHNEKTNVEIAKIICDYLDQKFPKDVSYRKQIKFVEDRHGHDFRYAIDPSKIVSELHWQPNETFETGIVKTIEWYITKYMRGDML